jgi:hypothetical protein
MTVQIHCTASARSLELAIAATSDKETVTDFPTEFASFQRNHNRPTSRRLSTPCLTAILKKTISDTNRIRLSRVIWPKVAGHGICAFAGDQPDGEEENHLFRESAACKLKAKPFSEIPFPSTQ